MELLSQYGLFLAKIATVVIAIAVVAVLIVNLTQRKRQRGELRITRLSEQYKEMQEEMSLVPLDSHQQKLWHKAQKKKHKQDAKAAKAKAKLNAPEETSIPRVYVLDFKGSMDAHEVSSCVKKSPPCLPWLNRRIRWLSVLRVRVGSFMVMGWRLRSYSVCVKNRSR